MSDHWTIIANPVSGRGRAKRLGQQVVEALREQGVNADLVLSEQPGDCERLAREAVDRGVRQIAACGGDGTVHEVVNGLAGSGAIMGIVPCGRGNDLARALNLPSDAADVVDMLVNGGIRKIDLGKIGDRFFITIASLGFDTAVAQATRSHPSSLGGTATYALGVLRTLMQYQCPEVQLTGDFGTFEGRILLVASANTPFYGSGIQIAPRAVVDDGVLDICIVKAMPRRTVLRLFSKVYSGSHVGYSAVQMVQTKMLKIESKDSLWLFADGEPMCETPAIIEIAPGALQIKVA